MKYTGCCPADSDLETAWRSGLEEEIRLIRSGIFEERAALMKLLGNPLRLRILVLLDRKDHSVYELMYILCEPQNLLSYNLGLLRKAGLVDFYYRSRHKTYRLTDMARSSILSCIRPGISR